MFNNISPEMIIRAYTKGIFPMGDSENPQAAISWYAPDPRCIIDLDQFHISKRLDRTYRSNKFELKVNSAWSEVLNSCAARDSTWITDEIYSVYTELHELGFAHSVEVYYQGELAGGLYGVSLGGAFMGESMFHNVRDASKIALLYLVNRLKERNFSLLDCQFKTEHLSTFGAVNIPREDYLRRLERALQQECDFD